SFKVLPASLTGKSASISWCATCTPCKRRNTYIELTPQYMGVLQVPDESRCCGRDGGASSPRDNGPVVAATVPSSRSTMPMRKPGRGRVRRLGGRRCDIVGCRPGRVCPCGSQKDPRTQGHRGYANAPAGRRFFHTPWAAPGARLNR